MYAGMVTVAGIVGTGGLPQFVSDVSSLPLPLLGLLSTFPLVLGIGVSFQLLLIKAHGSVVAAACQVFRKIASVAISMWLFNRVFGLPALVGSAFVSMSLIVKVWWPLVVSSTSLPFYLSACVLFLRTPDCVFSPVLLVLLFQVIHKAIGIPFLNDPKNPNLPKPATSTEAVAAAAAAATSGKKRE